MENSKRFHKASQPVRERGGVLQYYFLYIIRDLHIVLVHQGRMVFTAKFALNNVSSFHF